MSRIFLCHASEDKSIAEPVQLALVSAGHEVFYDEHSLPPGGDYHNRIHSAIEKCDLFVFVASPASITPGRFTLSELSFARKRWPSPVGPVLPVAIEGLEPQHLPAYLQAATVLVPPGNVPTEVRQAVQALLASERRLRRRAKLAFAGFCAVLLSATVTAWFLAAREQSLHHGHVATSLTASSPMGGFRRRAGLSLDGWRTQPGPMVRRRDRHPQG